jgi:hypothetical protein
MSEGLPDQLSQHNRWVKCTCESLDTSYIHALFELNFSNVLSSLLTHFDMFQIRPRLLAENGYESRLNFESEAVLQETMRGTDTKPGSLAAYLANGATSSERQNLTDLVRAIEDFEGSRGLTPANRVVEPDGCVCVHLGPNLRVEMRFRLASDI